MPDETLMAPGVWLTTDQLAARWGMAPKTLRNWRARKMGPPFVRGGFGRSRVLYQLTDIERIEIERLGKTIAAG